MTSEEVDELETRIRAFATRAVVTRSSSAYYVIEFATPRRFLFHKWKEWKRIEQWLDDPVYSWNPVLLGYEKAKEFAISMKSKDALQDFMDYQEGRRIDSLERQSQLAEEKYPVHKEEF